MAFTFISDTSVERLTESVALETPVELAGLDEAFQRATFRDNERTGTEEIPDGYYDTVVEEVRLGKTPRTGNPMLSWKLRILSEEFAGRVLNKCRVITDKSVAFLKDDLELCNVKLERLQDLPMRLDEMCGLRINALKRTKNQWTDIYFVRVERPDSETTPF